MGVKTLRVMVERLDADSEILKPMETADRMQLQPMLPGADQYVRWGKSNCVVTAL